MAKKESKYVYDEYGDKELSIHERMRILKKDKMTTKTKVKGHSRMLLPHGWREAKYNTNPPSEMVFESAKLKIIWVRKPTKFFGSWVVGGVNKRGYMSNKFFNTKSEAIAYAKEYMRRHPNG